MFGSWWRLQRVWSIIFLGPQNPNHIQCIFAIDKCLSRVTCYPRVAWYQVYLITSKQQQRSTAFSFLGGMTEAVKAQLWSGRQAPNSQWRFGHMKGRAVEDLYVTSPPPPLLLCRFLPCSMKRSDGEIINAFASPRHFPDTLDSV